MFLVFMMQYSAVATFLFLCPALVIASPVAPWASSSSTIHNFGLGVWPENLIVRENGNILGGLTTSSIVYEINPHSKIYKQIAVFSNRSSVFAFAETQQDLFHVVVNDFFPSNISGVPGTNEIYTIDMRKQPPAVSLLLDIPEASFFDGMDTLNKKSGL